MKVKIYLTMLAIGVTFANTTYAQYQYFSVGVRGGASSRNLTNGQGVFNLFSPSNRLNVSSETSVFAELWLNKTISIQPMVEYSSQGSKNGIFINSGQYNNAVYATSAQLNYLMFPVLAKLNYRIPDTHFKFYIDGGPFVSFLLSANHPYTMPHYDSATQTYQQSGYYNQNVKNQLKSTNVGIEGNIGLAYFFRGASIFAEGGGNYGLRSIQRDARYGSNRTGAATITLGFSIALTSFTNFETAEHFEPY